MEILLIIIAFFAIPILLGLFFNKQDKAKEENRQKEITNSAMHKMSNHIYMEKRQFCDGWAVVKLEPYRFAYVNSQGQYLNNELFVAADDFIEGTAVVRSYDHGVAIIDKNGKYVLPYNTDPKATTHIKKIWDRIYLYTITYYKKPSYVDHTDNFIVKQNGDYLFDKSVSSATVISDNRISISIGARKGEIDFSGKIINRPFKERVKIGNNLYRVRDSDISWGIYDESLDNIIIPCKYSSILYVDIYDIFILKPFGDGKRSFPAFAVNRNNQIVIPQKYDHIWQLENGYLGVSIYDEINKHNNCGVIDIKGQVIVQPLYSTIWHFSSGFFVTSHEFQKKCGKVKPNGYSDLEYDTHNCVFISGNEEFYRHAANDFTSDNKPYLEYKQSIPSFIIISKNNRYGVIDNNNNLILPIEYQSITCVDRIGNEPCRYILKKNNLFGVSDLKGKMIIPLSYNSIISHRVDEDDYPDIYNGIKDDYDYEGYPGDYLDGYEEFIKDKPLYFEVTEQSGKTYLLDENGNSFSLQRNKKTRTRKAEIHFTKERKKDVNRASTNTNEHVYLFFDTETTGVPKNYNAPVSDSSNWPRLVQLSWILAQDNGNVISKKDFIIKPTGFIIPPESIKLHGITMTRAINEGVELEFAISVFLEDVTKASILVGHNIDFDIKIVGAELYRLKIENPLEGMKSICTMKSSIDYCAIPGKFGYKWPKLDELYKELFDCTFDDQHNSASDVLATMKCFFELKKQNIIKIK